MSPGFHASRIRIVADEVNDLRQLVDAAPVGGFPTAPLVAVHGPQVAVLIGPFVPDGHLVVVQVADIGVAGDEPQQLVDNRAQVHLLGGQQREPVGQVETHLVAEYALGAYARSVLLYGAVLADVPQEVEILLHCL